MGSVVLEALLVAPVTVEALGEERVADATLDALEARANALKWRAWKRRPAAAEAAAASAAKPDALDARPAAVGK